MLVKITNKCLMGCTHCMEDAVPDGDYMSMETYNKVLDFIESLNTPLIMLSGGEPTDHPDILNFIKKGLSRRLKVLVMSNGLFLSDERREPVLNSGAMLQIINDPEYYPIKVERITGENIIFDTKLIAPLVPVGRAKKNGLKCDRCSPMCFNLRSFVRNRRDFKEAIKLLRLHGKFCIPSIRVDGSILAGESRFCSVVGTVESSNLELTDGIANLKCNKCGLVDNLDEGHKRAIGEL